MRAPKFGFFVVFVFILAIIFTGTARPLPAVTAATTEATQGSPITETGRKWTVVHELKSPGLANFVAFLDPDFGITAGSHGETHTTSDGGKTWTQGHANSLSVVLLDLVSKDKVWIGIAEGAVADTIDQGQTWTSDVLPIQGMDFIHSISFVDDQNGWLATSKMLMATSDGGKTWTEL